MSKNNSPFADLFRGISEQFYQNAIAELEQEKQRIEEDTQLTQKQKSEKAAQLNGEIEMLLAQNTGFKVAHKTLKNFRR